jgi:hypothetical protein
VGRTRAVSRSSDSLQTRLSLGARRSLNLRSPAYLRRPKFVPVDENLDLYTTTTEDIVSNTMSAIGSLVFCTDCGDLLDSSTGDASAILTCNACGAKNKGTSVLRPRVFKSPIQSTARDSTPDRLLSIKILPRKLSRQHRKPVPSRPPFARRGRQFRHSLQKMSRLMPQLPKHAQYVDERR